VATSLINTNRRKEVVFDFLNTARELKDPWIGVMVRDGAIGADEKLLGE
jgi:hypothetical protein